MKIYIVQKGDSAHDIAQKHGVSLSALKKLNTQMGEDALMPGMKIKVPTESKPVKRKGYGKNETLKTAIRPKRELNESQKEQTKESSEEESSMTLNQNTYTYKNEAIHAPSYPYNNGFLENPIEASSDGSIPMMDDPYPDAMQQKEVDPPYSIGQGSLSYPYGESSSQSVVPNPNHGYQNQAYPYYGKQSGESANPYGQGSGYSYPQTPSYYEGYSGYSAGNYGNYSNQGGQGAQGGQGYYGQVPKPYQDSYMPYRNPLGCRAEDMMPDHQENYYGQWKQAQEEAYPSAPSHSLDYENYMENEEIYLEDYAGEPAAIEASVDSHNTAYPYYTDPMYSNVPYGYSAPSEGHSEGYMTPQNYQPSSEWMNQQSTQPGYPMTGDWMNQEAEQTNDPSTGEWMNQQSTQPGYPMTGNWMNQEAEQTNDPSTGKWMSQGEPTGYPQAYPYNPYPPQNEGSYSPYAHPYPGYAVPQETNSPQSPYSPHSEMSQAPQYKMWESYVDYHEPPYQPDFPVQQSQNPGTGSK